jgi:hypothetical protein
MQLLTKPEPDQLAGLAAAEVTDQWQRRGLVASSDAQLVGLAARRLAVPRHAPADSFVLHAPLELMARSGLLRHVSAVDRERARQRIVWLAATYDAIEPIAPSGSAAGSGPPANVDGSALAAAVRSGDLDAIDGAAVALATSTTAVELVGALADIVVPSLAAAAHGSIFLYQLPRLLAADPSAPLMARGLLREIGRHPDWSVGWIEHRDPELVASGDLVDRLRGHPDIGDPGSHFIHPTMSLVERSGLAQELLASSTLGISVPEARRALLRTAARSMLQDDPAHAPYGWSHALTMPQAVLGIAHATADPVRTIAVAATYVLGFRATLGSTLLESSWRPAPRPDLDAANFLDAGPHGAAAAMWHAAPGALDDHLAQVVGLAATHHDAHLAKYTLACLDAARDDPAAARLFLAAAAHLAGWWRANDPDDGLFAA